MDIVQIQKLATLARLEVPEAELAIVAKEMETILGFIDEIQTITSNLSTQSLEQSNVFRHDIVAPIDTAHDLVEAAAVQQDHFVKVPKVIGE